MPLLNQLVKNVFRQTVKIRILKINSSASAIDPNLKWKSWFQSQEYQPIWSPSPHSTTFHKDQIQPLSHTELDHTSKYLLSRLDEITHCVDSDLSIDIPTTQECNAMIQNLANLNKGKASLEGRSHRAYLIWRKMEYCIDVRKDLQNGQNSSRIHYMPPKPNRETYKTLLFLHAQDEEKHHAGVKGGAPERAMEIVYQMEKRYDEGNWDAEPSVMIWNQVLASWAISNHPQKSYEAAEVLRNNVGDKADASSFAFVFRACASTNGSKKGKELAGKVSLKVWEELRKSHLISQKENNNNGKTMDRAPVMIAFAMKAVSLVEDESLRNSALKSQFDLACELGLVNTHILQIFQSKASSECFSNSLGTYKRKKATTMFQYISKDWKRNTKTKPSGW
jgi:hypothetical protein